MNKGKIMAIATATKIKQVRIGDKVKVLATSQYSSRVDIVASISKNNMGTELYFLAKGGCFSRRELELVK